MKAVLFDIDGTLVKCHGAGKAAMVDAAKEVFGTAGAMERIDFQGKTDPLIVRESLEGSGIGMQDIAPRIVELRRRYLFLLERNIAAQGVELLPGVTELLRALSRRDGLAVGLLTGNWREGARIKLAPHGLNEFFSFGVFGDDAENRMLMPAVARDRIRGLYGHDVPFRNMVIVGDTVHDIACAKHAGAVSAAVGTGWAAKESLLEQGPDLFFGDFSDTESVAAAILGGME